MKKLFILLVVSTLCSGVSFASFQVKKSQNVVSSGSVAHNDAVSAKAEVSKEKSAKSADKTQGGGKDGTVAIILAVVSVLFLPFGLHNWYLGRRKQALWQTLLVVPGFILLVPPLASWIWQLVDLIRLLINGGTL